MQEDDADDSSSVTTGIFDVDSSDSIDSIISQKQLQSRLSKSGKRSSSSGTEFSLSLNLPINIVSGSGGSKEGEKESLTNHIILDCEESTSASASFYKCSNEEQRRRHLANSDTSTNTDTDPSSLEPEPVEATALLDIQGSYLHGVIESQSNTVKYQIDSYNERNEEGEVIGVTYGYVGAPTDELFYEHIGKEVMEPEEIMLDEGERRRARARSFMLDHDHEEGSVLKAESETINIDQHSKRQLFGHDDGSELDLLIYYTKRGACQWLDEPYPCTLDKAALNLLDTKAQTWVTYMNTVMSNSEIDVTFVKVHSAVDPTYDEGSNPTSAAIDFAADDLRNVGDGKMDDAHVLRDEYSADFVVGFMYKKSGASGVGWIPTKLPNTYDAFSMTGGSYSLLKLLGVHEVGHNLGCNHHRSQMSNPKDKESFYGYANCAAAQCWVTVMSYRDVCNCSPITSIPNFSNPDIAYNGKPTGDSKNNNALQINKSKFGAAINRHRGSRSIYGNDSYTTDIQTLAFSVQAKKDITILNSEIYMNGGKNRVEFSIARKDWVEDDVLNDGFWDVVANEDVTPLSNKHSTTKVAPIGLFSSALGVAVAAGEEVSIRIHMPSGGGFRVAPTSESYYDVAMENDDLAITSGMMGAVNYLYAGAVTVQNLLYSVGGSDPPSLCADNEDKVTISVTTDDKGEETYWFLKQYRASTSRFFNVKKVTPGTYDNNTKYTTDICIKKNKCMKFVIKDKGKDGLCCDHGEGRWRVDVDDVKVKTKNMKDRKKQSIQWGDCP